MYGESAYGELAHMVNRLWRIGIWQKGKWRNEVVSILAAPLFLPCLSYFAIFYCLTPLPFLPP